MVEPRCIGAGPGAARRWTRLGTRRWVGRWTWRWVGRRTQRADGGAASLFMVALTGVVLLLGLAAVFMTAAGAAHRRAQAGADLAALAGASTLQTGGDVCVASQQVATRNDTELVSCRIDGDDVLVAVRAEGPEFLGHSFEIRGQARAGPESVAEP